MTVKKLFWFLIDLANIGYLIYSAWNHNTFWTVVFGFFVFLDVCDLFIRKVNDDD